MSDWSFVGAVSFEAQKGFAPMGASNEELDRLARELWNARYRPRPLSETDIPS